MELYLNFGTSYNSEKKFSNDSAAANTNFFSFLFGYFTDFGMWCVSFIQVNTYISRLLFVIFGVIVLGFGVSLSFIANVLMNSGEAFVKAVADTINKNVGNVKIGFDIFCVVLAVILSLLFFDFTIVGTREGTIISALFTGVAVKFFNKMLYKPLTNTLVK